MGLVRGDLFLLNDLTVGGVEFSKIGGIEHVKFARLATAGEQACPRDQERSGAGEVEVIDVHVAPVAGREPVDQLQAIGGIELQGAFIEVVDAVIAAAVAIAHEYVDVARAVDHRWAPRLPHPTAPIAAEGGYRREDAALPQRELVVRHHPPVVPAGILEFDGAEPEHDLVARERQRHPLQLVARIERRPAVTARDQHAGTIRLGACRDVDGVQPIRQ